MLAAEAFSVVLASLRQSAERLVVLNPEDLVVVDDNLVTLDSSYAWQNCLMSLMSYV